MFLNMSEKGSLKGVDSMALISDIICYKWHELKFGFLQNYRASSRENGLVLPPLLFFISFTFSFF